MANNRRNFIKSAFALGAGMFINLNKPCISRLNAMPVLSDGTLSSGYPLRTLKEWNGSTIMIATNNYQLWSDKKTKAYSLNGYPGAVVRKKKGDILTLQAHNMLKEDIALHFHGVIVPPDQDGHPKDAFKPDIFHTYTFALNQKAGTYYYHSSMPPNSGSHIFNGMYGLFIVTDDEQSTLNLPAGAFDVPLLLQDAIFDTNRALVYEPEHIDRMWGWLGNTVLVNGTPEAYLSVSKNLYRFRLVNASNARIFKIALSDGSSFSIISSDGGLLKNPVTVQSLFLAPGERYDIIIDFSRFNTGESIQLLSQEFIAPLGIMGSSEFPQGLRMDIIRFDIDNEKAASFSVPDTLSSIEDIDLSQVKNVRSFNLKMDELAGMVYMINGRLFDKDRIDFEVPLGAAEAWEFKNIDKDMYHPIHIHGAQFRIISRNGSTEIPEYERGWKDTFLVNPEETVRILIRFDHYEGTYLLQSTILEHYDDGMAAAFNVVRPSAVHDSDSDNSLVVSPNPAVDHIDIRGNFSNDAVITIFDGKGELAHSFAAFPSAPPLRIHLKGLAPGKYTLRIEDGKIVKSAQFIIIK